MRTGAAMQSGAYLSARGLSRPARVTVATLSLDATYATPMGRLCRLAAYSDNRDDDSFSFYYLDSAPIKDATKRDGFRLAAANIGLLREVAR